MTAPRINIPIPSIPVSRVSSSIADHLRREIIRGNLKEGDALPPEATLIAQWGVSRSTLREAFRVLENESLITVHRGAQGGAHVTPPQPEVASRHVGHLLQHRGATMGEIDRAVILVQPRAVNLITEQRKPEVIQTLQTCLDEEAELLDDPVAFSRRSLVFARLLTDECGDEMLRVFGEILYYLRAGAADYVVLAHFGGAELQSQGRKAVQWVHRRQRRLMTLIEDGEPRKAEQHWRAFLEEQLRLMPEAAGQLLYDAWPGHS